MSQKWSWNDTTTTSWGPGLYQWTHWFGYWKGIRHVHWKTSWMYVGLWNADGNPFSKIWFVVLKHICWTEEPRNQMGNSRWTAIGKPTTHCWVFLWIWEITFRIKTLLPTHHRWYILLFYMGNSKGIIAGTDLIARVVGKRSYDAWKPKLEIKLMHLITERSRKVLSVKRKVASR